MSGTIGRLEIHLKKVGDCYIADVKDTDIGETKQTNTCDAATNGSFTNFNTALKDMHTGKLDVGFVTVQRKGKWFISPTRSLFGLITGVLKSIDQTTFDKGLDGFSGLGFSSSMVDDLIPTTTTTTTTTTAPPTTTTTTRPLTASELVVEACITDSRTKSGFSEGTEFTKAMTACIDAKVAQGLTQYADVYFDELVPECFTSAYALQADPKATKEEIKAAFSAGDACADAKLKAIG